MSCKLTKAHAGPIYGLDRPCPIKIAERVPARPEISDIGVGICHSWEFRAPVDLNLTPTWNLRMLKFCLAAS